MGDSTRRSTQGVRPRYIYVVSTPVAAARGRAAYEPPGPRQTKEAAFCAHFDGRRRLGPRPHTPTASGCGAVLLKLPQHQPVLSRRGRVKSACHAWRVCEMGEVGVE